MRKSAYSHTNLARLILFLAVAGIHVVFILFFVIRVNAIPMVIEQPPMVMKLTDIQEEEPLPQLPPPPPKTEYTESASNTIEAIAETMIETDEVPDQIVVSGIIAPRQVEYVQEDYLPMHKVSAAPVFSEGEIRERLVYPPIALRAKIEGMVYLELFVDHHGQVRQITILRETPENRGFGEAAIKAFQGLQGKPAQANGAAVAVRYRYPVRFAIRG
ncbi:energy transducer TonB [Treponema primitia]|uniref:energy transducer TonB n=1 Tax=Treponema primitia TaxID=88058 RepID=UPI0002555596|nr:energy transducer TonB [Treponema primitia]